LTASSLDDARIARTSVAAYVVPTEAPESDGTHEWSSTTLVVVSLEAADRKAMGYTYADTATARLIQERLLPLLEEEDPLATRRLFEKMVGAIRNLGRPGIASMAISAVDAALWDLKGKLLGASLADLLGAARPAIEVYGSGGFTSYSIKALREQLGAWALVKFPYVKMKVGRDPAQDTDRVAQAREAIGPGTGLFVDANGAHSRKEALRFAQSFADSRVSWFEEPVSSDDLEGLRLLRDRGPAGMDISAGEYGYDLPYFRRMLEAQAVDVLQADATRCGGITGFMAAAALADGFGIPLSSHCAPALHVAPCCAAARAVHLEYFHDHARIEGMLFDGFRGPRGGTMAPDRSRPGLGIELKTADAERYSA
jgi:L-alanine-DL-glutamate epimerase-like enolase superfamily enzyme